MSGFIRTTLIIVMTTLCPACDSADSTGVDAAPSPEATRTSSDIASVPSIAGEWAFSERIWVLQPSELNGLIGAPPVERPMTQMVCHAEGGIELVQQGASFEGTATQSVICSVDGVEFVPPAFAFNPEFTISNGRIRGRSIYFETGHTLNVCDNRGSVRIRGGTIQSMGAIGNCPVIFDPGEHHSSWTMWRR